MKGQKQIIVFIHGMWGTKDFWDNYVKHFESLGYECKALTLPHHEKTSHNQVGNTSIKDYVEYVQKEIQKIGRPVTVIGHSMGGLIAQQIAQREPELVHAAVLITPASPRGVIAITASVLWCFAGVLFRWNFWKKPHKLSFKKAVYAMLHLMPEKTQKKIYDSFVYESGKVVRQIAFWSKTTKVDAKKVQCPVLCIAGKEDRITPASVVAKIEKRYKNATYKKYPHHAHWITQEPGWEYIANDIYRWHQTI